MAIEYRFMRKAAPTVRDDGKLHGRAWPYNSWTQIGKGPYGFREKINLGAGKKSINDGDIVLLDNHDTRLPLARMSAGTLTMRDTNGGGEWEATPNDTTYAQDVVKNVRAKNYGGCSFGFEVIRDKWTDDAGNPASPMDGTQREIMEMKVHEISVCTFPAYTATSVATKEMIRAARGMNPQDEREASADAYNGNDDDQTEETDEDRGGDAPGDGSKPYGNVNYADPGYQKDKKKRYPLDTKKHAKAAWGYINQAANAAKYTASQLSSIKSKIKSALSKFGVKVSTSEAKMADWQALCDFREMTEGFDPESEEREFDGGVLPVGVVRTEDVNWVARGVKEAADTDDRLTIIARASDLGIGDVLPDYWDGTGGIGAVANEDVKRDMDEIYGLALSMAPTKDALRILDLAQAYLTEAMQEQAKRANEEPEFEPEFQPLTLDEARAKMREAEDRRKALQR